jgi:glyoxylase-like metal-dependent hydrolase (beta-lactamase superfamily II)
VSVAASQSSGSGITCIDAGYLRPGVACFYLLESDGECAVIDTGTALSFPRLQQVMAKRNLLAEQMRYVIPTHVHLDHAGGAGTMMAAFPEAQLLVHPRGAPHLVDPGRLVASAKQVYGDREFERLYGEITPVETSRVREMEDRSCVSLGARKLEFRHTRGHANHHFCIWDETSRGWFAGDMFGISYPWFRFSRGDYLLPAATPTQFDPPAYLESVNLLTSYEPQRCYLTHYGELAFTSETVELLQRQVRGYAELASRCGPDREALETALTDYSLGLIQEMHTGLGDAALRQMLAFDMDLNAQGLAFWLEKERGAPG